MNKKQTKIYLLIILNIFWSIAAFIYDRPILSNVPFYFWPFIAICPVYPFLFSIIWVLKLYKKLKINQFLLAFSIIPSTLYFIGAIVYYLYWMYVNSFNIYALGQIFWVSFYGMQAVYIKKELNWSNLQSTCAIIFVLLSFLVQYLYHSYGYFDYSNISRTQEILMYLIIIVFFGIYYFFNLKTKLQIALLSL